MKIKTRMTMDNTEYQMEFEEKGEKETLLNAITLSSPPRYCQVCQNTTDFRLDSSKDKDGNIYIKVICKRCIAQANLGTYKSGGYFWHKFAPYTPKNKDNDSQINPQSEKWEE